MRLNHGAEDKQTTASLLSPSLCHCRPLGPALLGAPRLVIIVVRVSIVLADHHFKHQDDDPEPHTPPPTKVRPIVHRAC